MNVSNIRSEGFTAEQEKNEFTSNRVYEITLLISEWKENKEVIEKSRYGYLIKNSIFGILK